MAFLHGKAMSLCLFLLVGSMGFSFGAIYKVGDEKGWTMNDKPNYIAWAGSKKFHVGDELLFEYDKQSHNVLQVDKTAYHRCNTAKPIAVFNTGHDSITINSNDHLYFICGTPRHCQAGQKVSIKVSKYGAPDQPPPSIVEPPPPLIINPPPKKSQGSIAHGGLCALLLSTAIIYVL